MGRGPARGLLEKAGITLEEEDVEEEVKGQRAEVEKCGQEPPVLQKIASSAIYIICLGGKTNRSLHEGVVVPGF